TWGGTGSGAANINTTYFAAATGRITIATAGGTYSLSGTVFEDINYGGGAGRSLASSSGVGIAGVRVELYNSAGGFLSSTTTNASGVYTFSPSSGNYIVRVSSNGATGIRSTRANGSTCTTCVPVQTYRTNASSGTALAVTDHVGGQTPALVDAGDNTAGATLSSLTTSTTTAQSITSVTIGAANVTGVDFGFNFDTIVSIRDSSQGSLRQFLINANALGGEGSLTQAGQTAGQETSIFMIPNGAANGGQNTGYASQLTTSGANTGAAVITLTSGALPTISSANVSLDATTQTTNVGDTNSGTVGTGGTVGTMAQSLSQFNRPEVVILAGATQLSATGATDIIKGLAVANGSIIVSGGSSQVRECLAGMNADGSISTVYSGNYGITIGAGTGILIHHNYVKVNNSGIRGDTTGSNAIIEYNEVDSPAGTPGGGHTDTFDGILIVGTATAITIQYNLVKNMRGGGLEFGFAGGTVVSGTAIGNTITVNGFSSAGIRSTEPIGIVAWELSAGSALTIQQNLVTGNAGPGITVISATGVTITQNSIYANGSLTTDIGIELNSVSGDPNTYTAQGVTINTAGCTHTGPNNELNFPIIQTALIAGGNLVLRGWACPGSAIELFISAPDASGGFGSGKTYLTTLTEGSASDTDSTSSTYGPGAINGLLQGTDTTNRFTFTIPVPSGVAIGTVLTATETLAGNTSEFSGEATVVGGPNLFILKSANSASGNPGSVLTYTVQVKNTGTGPANTVTLTDSLGSYSALRISAYSGSPFNFTDGSPSSGLTLGTPKYSSDGGATWTYTLTSGGGGAPAGYDGNVTNWQIPMIGTMNANGANFTLNYMSIVK
ncbi:MAG TPA: SdrD B-like domain-containing protein, partial [Smithella sp.]|nr:SdrD B-like domain-containing protein [Smithella sp.]